ncbi:MAG: VCBS repeat-containing protein [Verrucomicrobia bacterium]|nr:VCBS repeat-containing protein [Verrucomicrobiota bacterium]
MSSRTLWCLTLAVLSVSQTPAHEDAPGTLWQRVENTEHNVSRFLLNEDELKNCFLRGSANRRPDRGGASSTIHHANSSAATSSESVIELPFPDGTLQKFILTDSQVMPPELALKYPEIKSYSGRSLVGDQASVRLNFCPNGLRAQIFTGTETIYVFSPADGAAEYVSTAKKNLLQDDSLQCLSSLSGPEDDSPRLASLGVERGGRQLRTYRLAIAASGEFTRANGGTVASAMSAIVSTINQVNGVYERELGIRLQLVPNTDELVFLNPNNDPYSANLANVTTLLENQETIDTIIGSANYDVGHLFNTAEFGLAYIGVVCREDWKARGCIGTGTPGSNLYFADFVAHEMAHQFGAHHTFNSIDGNCFGGRHPASAYEPGSGSTLMGYAGFCNNDNLQAHWNSYFHSASYDEIQQFVTSGTGASCPVITPTGNNPPVVDAPPHFIIPRNTAFRLNASGQDPDGDAITFCWEQRDLGPAQSVYDSDNGQSPIFRSMEPTPFSFRSFPRMVDLLNNTRLRGEQLPRWPRELHFRVTARDNRGGIGTADTVVTVADAGPLRFTSHNSAETFFAGQTITWEVAGTDLAPVNATHVNILLSTNGGLNFNIVLAANTPNDGSERVLFPNENIEGARLRVEAANNIFFAVNESNFNIQRYFSVADFNFDEHVDLLWQNDKGQLAAWFLDGTNFLQGTFLRSGYAVPSHWRLAAMSDFNSDAQADLLWHQPTTGRLMVWFMNGTELLRAEHLQDRLPVAAGWRIVSATDLDGDHQPDILMQRANGKLAVWKMNGTRLAQAIPLRDGQSIGLQWRAIAVSDFNADGAKDIVFRHQDGRLAIWIMNGFEYVQSQLLDTPRPDHSWKFGALADLDRNGQDDFIWRHTDGRIQVWFMSGSSAFRFGTLRNGSVGTQWRLMGPR